MHRWMVGLAALAVFAPGAARADWEYTKWGMTPDQVVKASNGAVKTMPPGQRMKSSAMHFENGASGSFTKGALRFAVNFDFDEKSQGLVCVRLTLLDQAQSAAFKEALTKSYGPPQGGSNAGLDMLSWTPGDVIEYIAMAGVSAEARHCKKGYGVLN